MSLTPQQQMYIEQRVATEGPNTGTAYILWIFLGGFGGHRFYLGQTGTAVAMLILTITVIGLIVSGPWCFVDLFLIPGIARQRRDALRQRYAYEAMYGAGAYPPLGYAAPPQPYPPQPYPPQPYPPQPPNPQP